MTSVICIIISVLSLVYFPATSAITQNQELVKGSSCRLQTSEKQGVCKLVSECPSAIAQIKKHQFPQLCGFEGDTAIICCVENSPQKNIRKSLEKCLEYVKGVESLAPNDRAKPKSGARAVRNEFPHMALLGFQLENGEKLWPCGGSLISERYVLTAASCVGSRSTGDVRWIKLGHLKRDDVDGIQVDVEQIIKHPDFKPPTKYHDIALLRTDRPIVFGPNVRPGCLYSGDDLPGKSFTNIKAVATGWGRIEYGGALSNDLLKVTLDQFTYEDCNKSYNKAVKNVLKDGIVPDTMLCYGSYIHGSDTCQGDSGGPLQIKREGPCCSYDLIGITSFGKACGLVAVPGVYTKISYYVPWIESIVWP